LLFSTTVLSLMLAALPAAPKPATTIPAAAPAAPAAPPPAPTPAELAQQAAITSAAEALALRQENAHLKEQVDQLGMDAKTAPVIDRENQQLRERIIMLETEHARLTHENQSMSSWRDGFKAGAVIFFLGVVFGLLIDLLFGRFRQRGGWSDI
jgi:hypothetical protein